MANVNITINRCTVSAVQEKTSKAGKPYKVALIFADGGMGLLQAFVSDDATPPPVGQPISVQFEANVGYQGDLRFAWNKETKFKAL